ncbi:hypothetical protein BDW22DRAFT_1363024 [Trametopsis cervina]|nr:hypothetical protein BDW22DRAFT_1363024 [Trametopsis cervina]
MKQHTTFVDASVVECRVDGVDGVDGAISARNMSSANVHRDREGMAAHLTAPRDLALRDQLIGFTRNR